MWKGKIVAYFGCYTNIVLEGLKKATKILCDDRREKFWKRDLRHTRECETLWAHR